MSIVSAMYATRSQEGVYIHSSFGRIINQMAVKYEKVFLCVPVWDNEPTASRDYQLSAPNIVLVEQPYYSSSRGGFGESVWDFVELLETWKTF